MAAIPVSASRAQPPFSRPTQPPSYYPNDSQSPTTLPALLANWVYRDPAGQVQGPFSAMNMHEWMMGGFFPDSLPIKHVNDSSFITLAQFKLRYGSIRPFLLEQEDLERKYVQNTASFNNASTRTAAARVAETAYRSRAEQPVIPDATAWLPSKAAPTQQSRLERALQTNSKSSESNGNAWSREKLERSLSPVRNDSKLISEISMAAPVTLEALSISGKAKEERMSPVKAVVDPVKHVLPEKPAVSPWNQTSDNQKKASLKHIQEMEERQRKQKEEELNKMRQEMLVAEARQIHEMPSHTSSISNQVWGAPPVAPARQKSLMEIMEEEEKRKKQQEAQIVNTEATAARYAKTAAVQSTSVTTGWGSNSAIRAPPPPKPVEVTGWTTVGKSGPIR
jgi:hypothetical protein